MKTCSRIATLFKAMTDVRSPYFTRTKNKNIAVKRELKDSAVHSKKTINNKRIKTAVKLEPEKEIVVKREPGTKWEPRNWLAQLENIREMRKEKNAPVDTMGCEKCKGENYTEKERRFHTLVSLMLSSQTKDHITHAAMVKLIEHGLTVLSILEMSDDELGTLIYPVGFWKKKINYLKNTAAMLKESYDCDIPRTVKGLTSLSGVGPKMAYLVMSCAWNEVVGIGVDVHVHRIANRLDWVKKKRSVPEATRKDLEDWLPQSYWREVNWLLVGFGQQICLPVSPKCSDCLNKNICPASTAKDRKKFTKKSVKSE